MATSHPYISGPGNVASMIKQLRKSFPSTVTSDTVKKLSLAPNNESYVINALQFIGVVDGEGKRTPEAAKIFSAGDDEFKKGFEKLIRNSYKELFDIHGDNALSLDKGALTQYFRQTDHTSDAIGQRQAGVFQTFAALAGHGEVKVAPAKGNGKTKAKPATSAFEKKPGVKSVATNLRVDPAGTPHKADKGGIALSVRIEINGDYIVDVPTKRA